MTQWSRYIYQLYENFKFPIACQNTKYFKYPYENILNYNTIILPKKINNFLQ